eukprot:gene7641-10401_t
MDDSLDFLDELSVSDQDKDPNKNVENTINSVTTPKTSTTITNNTDKNSDLVTKDDLDDIFDAVDSVTVLKTAQDIENDLFTVVNDPLKEKNTIFSTVYEKKEISSAITDHDDFLSWLDEGSSPSAVTNNYNPPISSNEMISSATYNQPTDSITSIDNFFDEVFGDNKTLPEENNKTNEINAHSSSILMNNSVSQDAAEISTLQMIEKIVKSSFPDISQLKLLLLKCGYIPSSYRCQIWSLLLTGSFEIDEEANSFKASSLNNSNNSEKSINQTELINDCQTLVNSLSYRNQLNIDQIVSDMNDVLVLYFLRRNLDYSSLLTKLIAPLMTSTTKRAQKGVISASFYSLVTNFIPMLNLKPSSTYRATQSAHKALHWLVTYHSPTLVQHLDRVLPGWELPTKPLTLQQESKISNNLRTNLELDELEKQYGVELGTTSPNSTTTDSLSNGTNEATQNNIISSAPPNRNQIESGCIPTHWITGLFTGSVPPNHVVAMLDWAIINRERYAGIFFVSSLLEIFSSSLLKMTGVAIEKWFAEVAMNSSDWFKSIPLQIIEEKDIIFDWKVFVKGWIHSTADILLTTPQAFRDALDQTEEWASSSTLVAIDQKNSSTSVLDQPVHGQEYEPDDEQSPFQDVASDPEDDEDDENIYNDEDEEDYDPFHSIGNKKSLKDSNNNKNNTNNSNTNEETNNNSNASNIFLFGKNNLMDKFKKLSLQFQKDLNTDSTQTGDESAQQEWLHDRKLISNEICLWSDPAEVIPCICSNRRRPTVSKDISSIFLDSIVNNSNLMNNSTNDHDDAPDTCFLTENRSSFSEKPFYFGIDCRTETEKQLGLFPKAYSMDPIILTDTEELTKLLQVIEPLSSTVHICLIGSGKAYYDWYYKNKYPNKKQFKTKGSMELSHAINEQTARLNAVAMYFLKRSFKHISVLEGGFVSAVKYLHRMDSHLSVSGALVDVDRALLDSILGIPSSSFTSHVFPTSSNNNPLTNIFAINRDKQPQTTSQQAPAVQETAKQLLSGFTKSIGIFGKSVLAVTQQPQPQSPVINDDKSHPKSTQKNNNANKQPENGFIIDEPYDDGMGPKEMVIEDTTTINISKTEVEKAQALALHKMAGLTKGDSITINRTELPGAILFPAIKYKEIDSSNDNYNNGIGISLASDKESDSVKRYIQVHRFLVVSKERFLVLDSNGEGVGSSAVVKSNHHLTELVKMTFRKKDPELVTLFFLGSASKADKTKLYRVSKRKEFVEALQKNMQRFR